tara:strand:- start:1248 stop:1811 length:564 start_codon:yes stop_codon:yes gene_type:complete
MSTPQVTHLKNALSDDQIKKIHSLMEKRKPIEGGLSSGQNNAYRNVQVKSFAADDNDLSFVSEIISDFGQTVNEKYYNFDVKGFAESIQYLFYKKGGLYNSHMDLNWSDLNTHIPNRKLTIITQLSDTKDYSGGDIKIEVDNVDDFVIPRQKGDMICFPAFLMHKVYPILGGTRYSLVSWLSGDSWK